MRVKIDPNLCAGCGYCTTIVPEVLEIQDLATVKASYQQSITDPVLQEKLRQVAAECPCGAILIEEDVPADQKQAKAS
jgi:ferredoxin